MWLLNIGTNFESAGGKKCFVVEVKWKMMAEGSSSLPVLGKFYIYPLMHMLEKDPTKNKQIKNNFIFPAMLRG